MSLIRNVFDFIKENLGLGTENEPSLQEAEKVAKAKGKEAQKKILNKSADRLSRGAAKLEELQKQAKISLKNSALGIIDVQVDFCNNFGRIPGNLAVTGSDAIVPLINHIRKLFRHAFLTQDFHPPGHISFASTHGNAQFSVKKLEKYTVHEGFLKPVEIDQIMWPDHCIQGTSGANFHKDLDVEDLPIARKGRDTISDSYGIFENNYNQTDTELEKALQAVADDDAQEGTKIKNLFLCGIALDVCVLASCQQAIAKNYRVILLLDACAAVNQTDPDALTAQLDALEESGVIITTTAEVQRRNLLPGAPDAHPNAIKMEVRASQDRRKNIRPTEKDLAISPLTPKHLSDFEIGIEETKSVPHSHHHSTAIDTPPSGKKSIFAAFFSKKESKEEVKEDKKPTPIQTAEALQQFLNSELQRLMVSRSAGESNKAKAFASQKLLAFEAISQNIGAKLAEAEERKGHNNDAPTIISMHDVDTWSKMTRTAANQHESHGIKRFFSQLFHKPRSANLFDQALTEKNGHFHTKLTAPGP